MNLSPRELEDVEPERYELREGPSYHFEVSRREFVATVGAGLLISFVAPRALAQATGRGRRGGGAANLAARLHLGADGVITVFTSKVEVGQGSRTQLSQAAAEELHVPVENIRLVMGDTAGPDDGGTAGSATTPAAVPAIRKACAAARLLLIETAAATHTAETNRLSVLAGTIQGLPAGKTFSYADLAAATHADALKREVAPGVVIARVAEWKILGTPVPKTNAREIVTGKHRYPSDIVRPGMLYGKVLRAPSYGATLTEIDLPAAQALPGTVAVRDGAFAGVAASSSFAAAQAAEALGKTARWKPNEAGEQPSSEDLYAHLRAKASPRSRKETKGTVAEAFQSAPKVLRATYPIAYIQHVPLEPRAAVAEWTGDQLTVWTGSQQPARVREDLAQSLNVPAASVRVIVPDTGGGFGGKHTGEVAVEAARLARAAGKPVLVRWSREEEFTWAYFRPAGVIDLAGALDEKHALIAWEHINFNSGASAIATPYAIPGTSTEFKTCEQPLRSGSYRGLAATANTFARESFMDEIAATLGEDPLEFRLRHLANDRLRAVLTAAAERFGWKKEWKSSTEQRARGIGLACGTEKGSYVACCARVEVNESEGTFRVAQVVEAFECGAIQNPGNLKSQVEGSIIQGLGGALTEEMRFRDGKILNATFSRYRVPRFKDVPAIETVLVDRPDLTSAGAGETPIIAIAPAVANALFQATQARVRTLPIRNPSWRVAG